MKPRFEVLFMNESREFLAKLDIKARDKIIFNIDRSRINQDKELFKKLRNEIWESRTLYNKTHYRVFAFWDKSNKQEALVIATHGIIKKTDKTPLRELDKADSLREIYFKFKIQQK